MDIDRCNSIFELFTAFNFTYAVLSRPNDETSLSPAKGLHSPFVDIIDSYLIKPFNELSIIVVPVEQRLSGLKVSLVAKKESSNDPVKQSACDDLLRQVSDTDRKIKVRKSKIDEKEEIAKDRINIRFPHASFVLALFCISVLILAASQSQHKHFTLLLIDIALLFEVTWFFVLPEFRYNKLGYRSILYTYLFLLFFVVVFHFSLKFYVQKYHCDFYEIIVKMFDKNEELRPFFVLVNLIIPSLHFVIYYVLFRHTIHKLTKELKQKASNFNDDIDLIEEGHDELGNYSVDNS